MHYALDMMCEDVDKKQKNQEHFNLHTSLKEEKPVDEFWFRTVRWV